MHQQSSRISLFQKVATGMLLKSDQANTALHRRRFDELVDGDVPRHAAKAAANVQKNLKVSAKR